MENGDSPDAVKKAFWNIITKIFGNLSMPKIKSQAKANLLPMP